MSNVAFRPWLLAAALLATPSLARAEPDLREPASANAAELFQEALRDYDRGDLETAIAKLRRAQAAAPHPTVLYNLAQFLDAAGHHAEAFRCFEQYLTIVGAQIEPAREQAVRGKLRALRQRLASFRFEMSPAQAVVQVDGETVARSSELLLSPGSHHFEANWPGFEPVQLELSAVEGEAQRVVVQLKPSGAPASPPPTEGRASPASSPPPQRVRSELIRPSQPTRTWAVVALATGAALVGGAVVLQAVGSSRTDDWRTKDRELDGVDPRLRDDAYWAARARNAELARGIRQIEGVELGLFIGAGALAATGVGLWLTTPAGSSPKVAGLTFRRSF